MDDDDLRRGLPTCHKKFGEALAILAGDAPADAGVPGAGRALPAADRRRAVAGSWPAAPARPAWSAARSRTWPGNAPIAAARQDPLSTHRAAALARSARTHSPHKTGALFRACLRLGVWAAQGERDGGPDRDLLDAARRLWPLLRPGLSDHRRPARRRGHGGRDRQARAEGRGPRQADVSRPARRRGKPPPGQRAGATRRSSSSARWATAAEPLAALVQFVLAQRSLNAAGQMRTEPG